MREPAALVPPLFLAVLRRDRNCPALAREPVPETGDHHEVGVPAVRGVGAARASVVKPLLVLELPDSRSTGSAATVDAVPLVRAVGMRSRGMGVVPSAVAGSRAGRPSGRARRSASAAPCSGAVAGDVPASAGWRPSSLVHPLTAAATVAAERGRTRRVPRPRDASESPARRAASSAPGPTPFRRRP